MIDLVEWVVLITGYGVGGGFTFRSAANHTDKPQEPWETPMPFLSGVFWPVMLPAIFGAKTVGDRSKGSRKQRKILQQHKDALVEAECEREIAAVKAQTAALWERTQREALETANMAIEAAKPKDTFEEEMSKLDEPAEPVILEPADYEKPKRRYVNRGF